MIENNLVTQLIKQYPNPVQKRLSELRKAIFETASKINTIEDFEETIKWGEPAYLTKNGSTLRFDWKEKTPHQYSLYFNCKTKLIDSIKERYGELFNYSGNRELILKMDSELPINEIKKCIELALTYHTVKHIPLLGL